MIKGAAAKILSYFLSNYIEGLNSSQLEMSLWNGTAKLEDISIKSDALTSQHIPMTVKRGKMSLIFLELPWGRLDSQSCQIKLENIYAVTDVTGNALVSKDLEVTNTKVETNKEAEQGQGSMFTGLITKIVDNLKVSIKNIHIRMELNNKGTLTAIGLVIKSIDLYSVDEKGEPKIYPAQSKIIRKKLVINGLGLYVDPNANYIDTNDIYESMASMYHQFIIDPFSTETTVVLNKGANPDQRISVYLYSPTIKIVMNKLQYLGISALVRQFNYFVIRRSFSHCGRPDIAIEDEISSRLWWNYATKSASYMKEPSIFYPQNALKVLRNRKKYVELVQSKDPKLEDLEDKLGPSSVVLLRSYADYVIKQNLEPVLTKQEAQEMQTELSQSSGPIYIKAKFDDIDLNLIDEKNLHLNLNIQSTTLGVVKNSTYNEISVVMQRCQIENVYRSITNFKWSEPLKFTLETKLTEKSYKINIPKITTYLDYKSLDEIYQFLDAPKYNENKLMAKKNRSEAVHAVKLPKKIDVIGDKFDCTLNLLSSPLMFTIESYKFIDYSLQAENIVLKSDDEQLLSLPEFTLDIDNVKYSFKLNVPSANIVLSSNLISQIIDFIVKRDYLIDIVNSNPEQTRNVIYADVDIKTLQIDLKTSKVISTIILRETMINAAEGIKFNCQNFTILDEISNQILFTKFDFDMLQNHGKLIIPTLSIAINQEFINNVVDFANKTTLLKLELPQKDKKTEEYNKPSMELSLENAKATLQINNNSAVTVDFALIFEDSKEKTLVLLKNVDLFITDNNFVFSPILTADLIKYNETENLREINIGSFDVNITRREIDVLGMIKDLKIYPLQTKSAPPKEFTGLSKNIILSHGQIKLSFCFSGVEIKPPIATLIFSNSGTENEELSATILETITILTPGLTKQTTPLLEQTELSVYLDFKNQNYKVIVHDLNVFISYNFLLGLREIIFSKDYYCQKPMLSITNSIGVPIQYTVRDKTYELDVGESSKLDADLMEKINLRIGNENSVIIPATLSFPYLLSTRTAASLTSFNGRKSINIISPFLFRNESSVELSLMMLSGTQYSEVARIKPFGETYLPFTTSRNDLFSLVTTDYYAIKPPSFSLMKWNTCTEYYVMTKTSKMKCILFFDFDKGLGLIRIVPNFTFINELPIPISITIQKPRYIMNIPPGSKVSLANDTDLIVSYVISAKGFKDSEEGTIQTIIDTHTKSVLRMVSADGLRRIHLTVNPHAHEQGVLRMSVYASCIFVSAINEQLMASNTKGGEFSIFTDMDGFNGFLFGGGDGIMNNCYIKVKDYTIESRPISVLNIGDRKTIFLPRSDSNLFFPLSYLVDDAPPQFKHANIFIISYALSIYNKSKDDFVSQVENSEKTYEIKSGKTVEITSTNEKLSFIVDCSRFVLDRVGRYPIIYHGKLYELTVVEKHYGLQAILSELSHNPPLKIKNASNRLVRVRQKGIDEFVNIFSKESKPFGLKNPFDESLVLEIQMDEKIAELDLDTFENYMFFDDLFCQVMRVNNSTVVTFSDTIISEKTISCSLNISGVNVSFISPRNTELMTVNVQGISILMKGDNPATLNFNVESLKVCDMYPKAVFHVIAASVTNFIHFEAKLHLWSPKNIISSFLSIGCVNIFIDLSFVEEFYDYLSPVIHHPRKFPPKLPGGSIDATLKHLKINKTNLIFTLRSKTKRPKMAHQFPEELSLIPDVTTSPLSIPEFQLKNLSGRPTSIALYILDQIKSDVYNLLPSIIARADILFNAVGISDDPSVASVLRSGEGFVKSVSSYVGMIGGDTRKSEGIAMTPEEAVIGGLKSLAHGFKHGIKGIVEKPLEGAKRGGFLGGLKGLANGLAGAVAKPVSGVLDAGAGLIGSAARALDDSMIYKVDINKIKLPKVFLRTGDEIIISKIYKQLCIDGRADTIIAVSPFNQIGNVRILVVPRRIVLFTVRYEQFYIVQCVKGRKIAFVRNEGAKVIVKYEGTDPTIVNFENSDEAEVFASLIMSIQRMDVLFNN